ncbi:DUF2194 domain-containing protein [Tenacibaculum xiamenense]|uniref:DUF2194 domain-containing protein n=1 Tax=Tenacibaculum xiamenense TaxID=1261553 RepID=UPI0038934181
MKRKANQFIKIGIILFLFACSVYGFYSKNNSPLNSSISNSKKEFSKSNFFVNKKSPLISFLGNSLHNNSTLDHIKQLCDYTKIPFYSISLDNLIDENYQLPNSLKVICLDKTESLTLKAIEKLIQFTAKGGTIILTNLPTDQRLNYLIGLQKKTSLHSYNTTAKGILFENNFTPNLNKVGVFKDLIHYGFNKRSFHKNVKTILSSINEKNYPVILENTIGSGKVILFNTTFEISKYERGLLFPCIISSLEGVPYPIANVNTIFLDDFPSPVYPFMKEPILSEFNISSQKFVKDIWWPDMLKLAKKYNLHYTTTIIFDYEENVEPPFSYKQWNLARDNFVPISHQITQDVLNTNHELGIHGYNHVSLLKKSWTSENIKIAMNTVKKMWDVSDYGHHPISYIPPSNYIDKQGVLALHAGLPSLKYMCSLYTGKLKKGGDREFNPEPYTHEMFDFPRNTSGFYLNNFKKYLKESMFLYTGIWSHFVHPDDVYQIPTMGNIKTKGEFSFRNKLGLNWRKTNDQNLAGMYPTFEKLIQNHIKNYPFTKFPDVKTAGKLVSKLRVDDFEHEINNELYTVHNLTSKQNQQDWLVYISTNNSRTFFKYLVDNNYPFTKTKLLDGFIINIKTPNGRLRIPNLDKKTSRKVSSNFITEFNNFRNYKETDEELLSEKLKFLRDEIFKSKEASIETWNKYAKYAGWAKQENLFWNDLELYYYKHQNYQAACLPELMAKFIWYPSERSKLIWLERKIITANKIETKLSLLEEYIKNYNSKNNRIAIQEKLKLMAELNPTIENKIAYISAYLWSESNDKLGVLSAVRINSDYKRISNELAWYFYEQKQLSKAIQWASISDKITIDTQLYWLFETKNYKKLESFYIDYKYSSVEEKFLADKTMIDLYLAKEKFLKAWNIASKIDPSHPEYKSIRKKLNTFFLYQNRNIQKRILDNNPFLYKKNRDSIQRIIMIEENNVYSIRSILNTNRADISTFDKRFTYSLINKKKHVHNFSFTHSLVNDIVNRNGKSFSLYGLDYKFENSKSFSRVFQYSGNFGFETDRNKYFYHFGIQGSYNLESSLFSLNYKASPVRNNVGFNDFLYVNSLGLYYEKNFKNKISTTAYLESNYYTDNNSDVTLSLAMNYPVIKYGNNIFRTVAESSHSLGTTNLDGIPYWMTTNRHFAGGGLQYQLNTDIDKTFILLDGMYFYDSYSSYFSRYRAKFNFHLQKYFTVNFSGELFQHNLYYSNSFNIGLSFYAP